MKKKVSYWLTVPGCSHIKDITIKPKSKPAIIDDLHDELWLDTEKEANDFLKDLKKYLRDSYCNKYNHKDRADWMTEEWINKESKS